MKVFGENFSPVVFDTNFGKFQNKCAVSGKGNNGIRHVEIVRTWLQIGLQLAFDQLSSFNVVTPKDRYFQYSVFDAPKCYPFCSHGPTLKQFLQ